MDILITGGTGFIGTALCRELLGKGHRLCVLTRYPDRYRAPGEGQSRAVATLSELPDDEHFDAIINLVGEGIAERRWSKKRKAVLLASRLDTTQALLDFIARANHKPQCLINGSAVGFYGHQGNAEVDESTAPHSDFGHHLCVRWEQLAEQAQTWSVRVCVIRIGLVVGPDGGFLKRLLLPFKLGLGGRLGNGRQWISWVHRQDLIRLIIWLLDNDNCHGVYNGTAPKPVTNRELTRTLAACLKRPAPFPVPAILLKLLLGEMASLLLNGQRVKPKRALAQGFTFQFSELQDALKDVL